jgi:hypothetical protein
MILKILIRPFHFFLDKKVDKKSRKFETLRFLLSHKPALTTQKARLLRAHNSSTQIFKPTAHISKGTDKLFLIE